MKLVSVSQMVAIEKEADASGLTYELMMENAGRGLAEAVQDIELQGAERRIVGLVGPGNNGGDTLVALALLASLGWNCRAYLLNREQDAFVARLVKAGGEVASHADGGNPTLLSEWVADSTILLDGLLGTGARPPLRAEMAAVLREVNGLLDNLDDPPFVVAVDCPSGIDCDTGEAAEESLPADLTVTMAAVKHGLLAMPAFELAGDLRVVDIGLPADLPAMLAVSSEVAEEDLVAQIMPPRPPLSHKGTFGAALVVAGSVNYTGAAYLAGSAAYRIGAGLVTLAVPAPLHAALSGQFPEATWLLLPHELGVISRDAAAVLAEAVPKCQAVLIGPGLGTERTTQEFLQAVLEPYAGGEGRGRRMGFVGSQKGGEPHRGDAVPAMVLDADALKLLARMPAWPKSLPGVAVLTPHPGELSILTGLPKEDIQKNRRETALRFASEWGHVVVLKGAFTVVASPSGSITVIPVASAALARAGTGDVLAGLIVGLRAQGVDPYPAAVAGAWIHAQAGLYAARQVGNLASVLAGDVLECVADVISDLPLR